MAEVTNPFFEVNIDDCVVLEPHQLDNDIPDHLRAHLEKRVGRCTKHGLLVKVGEITSYGDALMKAEDLNARPEFAVSFNATVCCPEEGHVIVAQVQKLGSMLVITSNGPIFSITQFTRDLWIDMENFAIVDGNIVILSEKNRPLAVGDIVKIQVLACKFAKNDRVIKVVSKLCGMANDQEATKLFTTM